MKGRSTFWLLLKSELTWGTGAAGASAAVTLLVYWFFIGAFPLLVLFGDKSSSGNLAALFEGGFLLIMAFLLLSGLTVWIASVTIPAFAELLPPNGAIPGAIQNLGSFEFLFTRAVDRRVLFRAKTTAFMLFALTPFILNLLFAPLAPEIRFGPADSMSTDTAQRRERYVKAFPSSYPATRGTIIIPGQIVIPHGTVRFMSWLAWNGALALFLLQGYSLFIARHVKPNRTWTALFPIAPIFVLFGMVAAAAREKSARQACENCFLFFANHSLAMVVGLVVLVVVIQIWSELRFSKLEIC
jgi:hypothetical protein